MERIADVFDAHLILFYFILFFLSSVIKSLFVTPHTDTNRILNLRARVLLKRQTEPQPKYYDALFSGCFDFFLFREVLGFFKLVFSGLNLPV